MEKWFRGFHHLYLGIAMVLGGFFMMGTGWYWTGGIIIFLGFCTMVDDVVQHFKQRKNPEYQSPLHRLYVYIWKKFAFIRWLNKIADKIFGR